MSASLQDRSEQSIDVTRLRFNHQDDAVVAEVCVGAVQHGKVWHLRHGDAVEGFGTVGPDLTQRSVIAAAHRDGVHKVQCLKAGRQDNEVVVVGFSCFGLDAGCSDGGDLLGDEGDVWESEGWVVVIADDDTLAPWIVVWTQLSLHLVVVREGRVQHFSVESAYLVCADRRAVPDDVVEGFAVIHLQGSFAPHEWRDVSEQASGEG